LWACLSCLLCCCITSWTSENFKRRKKEKDCLEKGGKRRKEERKGTKRKREKELDVQLVGQTWRRMWEELSGTTAAAYCTPSAHPLPTS
jgi:hypothetical protein